MLGIAWLAVVGALLVGLATVVSRQPVLAALTMMRSGDHLDALRRRQPPCWAPRRTSRARRVRPPKVSA